MCRFIQIFPGVQEGEYIDLYYLQQAEFCYQKYLKYLQDDFSPYKNLLSIIEKTFPYFWIVTKINGEFTGFVFLDNFIGNEKSLYSAELTTCFDKKAWGVFTRYSAKIFLKKCFDKLGLYKIKAQVYPDNSRVKRLLKSAGFVYESTLKNETRRQRIPQNIEVYALYKNYYYKTR